MLKNMKLEELEILSYTDLTELILKEENKTFTTPEIFHKICDLLDYSEEDYTNKIGEYYTSLTTDKRFVFLENNEWDLREKTQIDIILNEDKNLNEEIDKIDEELEENDDNEYEDDIDTAVEDDDLDADEELDDLAILTDEELEEN